MKPDRWQQLLAVFDDALEVASEVRPSFVKSRCGGDAELAAEVDRMLAAHDSNEGFMARPAFAVPVSLPGAENTGGSGYRLIRAIGSGGMGVVHLAEQIATGRTVAIKVIGPWAASESLLRRFQYEVKTLAQLQHPAIAQVFEAGTLPESEGGRPFFAMEFVEGRPLLGFVTEGNLGTAAKLELFLKICDGVQHAHQKGVIHRDLKPANILVTRAGEPKILDFGVARVVGDDAALASMHTREGQLIGTLAYMSPEQVSGESEGLDTRSDVYALGVILHEILTGRPPYDLAGKSLVEAGRIIREEDPSRLSSIERSFRGDLDVIVAKCLEKNRDRRYRSVAELSTDVRRYLRDEPIVARPASAWYQISKFGRRNRLAVASAVVVLAALVLGIAGTGWQAVLATRARNDALEAEARAVEGQRAAKAQAEAAQAVVEFIDRILTSVQPTAEGRDAKVFDLLSAADRQLDGELKSQPEAWYTLRNTLAASFESLARHVDAEREVHLVLDQAEKDGRLGDRQARHARNTLALVRDRQGKFGEAIDILRTNLEQERDADPAVPRDEIRIMGDLGNSLHNSGRSAEAESLLREAEQKARTILGERDMETLHIMVNRGATLLRLGKTKDARDILQQAAAGLEEQVGPEDTWTLSALEQLANLDYGAGNLSAAEAQYRRIWEVRKRVYGERHPETLVAMINLGDSLRGLRRLPESEEVTVRGLELCREVLGPDNPLTLTGEHNYASLLANLGRWEEAARLGEQALEARSRVLGPDHPFTLSTMNALSTIYAELKRYDDALGLIDRAIEGRTKVLGLDHAQTFRSRDIRAEILHRMGRFEEAEASLRELIASASVSLSADHPQIFVMRRYHARCLWDLKRWDEAQAELLDARGKLEGKVSVEDWRWISVNKTLVELYEAWGKPDEADRYRELGTSPPP